MLIFFGTRSSKIHSNRITSNTECPHCNSQNSFIYSVYGTYFHIFWIPMFRLGRRTIVECSHCKKTYGEEELSESVRIALNKTLLEAPQKKAYWHCAGCFIILGAIGLFVLLLIYALIFKTVKEDDFDTYDDYYDNEEIIRENTNTYENDHSYDWKYQLKKNMLDTDYSPDITKDKYSYSLKLCLDAPSVGLEESTTGYFTHISENKIIILVEAEKIDVLSINQKNKVYEKINNCLDNILEDENHQRYIGVFNNKTFSILITPDGVFKDKDAEKEKLQKFYTIVE